MDIINGILPENVYPWVSIVFYSSKNFARTFECFLTTNATSKIVMGGEADLMRAALQKLAAVSKSLGSDKEPI